MNVILSLALSSFLSSVFSFAIISWEEHVYSGWPDRPFPLSPGLVLLLFHCREVFLFPQKSFLALNIEKTKSCYKVYFFSRFINIEKPNPAIVSLYFHVLSFCAFPRFDSIYFLTQTFIAWNECKYPHRGKYEKLSVIELSTSWPCCPGSY